MSRRRDVATGDLFTSIPAPAAAVAGSMDYRKPVAQLISQMLKDTDLSRFAVAARMSELAEHETSKAVLDSYTAESREAHNLPMWKAPVLELATGSRLLAEWHARVLGGRVLWGSEVLDADIGRRQREIARMQEEVKALQHMQRGRR